MERKVSIPSDRCTVGMKLAESVFNNYGAVIIAENTVLDEDMVERLNRLDITKVKVYLEEESDTDKPEPKLVKEYNVSVESVKNVIKDISEGKDLDLEKVEKVADNLLDKFHENKNVFSCIKQIRTADEYTYNHCVNVSLLAMMIGNWLKMSEDDVKNLVYAGLLHDIGKSKVDINILNKPGRLTDEEYAEMKKHVVYGQEILKTLPDINKDVFMGVIMHHEREDGSGYMLGAKGNQIHRFGKIIAVADVYDAMTSNRVYRPKQNPFDVFEHIRVSSYSSLDTEIALTFLQHIASYYIGDTCKLSSGETGEILQINPRNICKPLVRIDNAYVDLADEADLKIVEIL